MNGPSRLDSNTAVLDAILRDDIDDAAEQLAVLRAYAELPGDSGEQSTLSFAAIRSRIEVADPWYRRLEARWVFGGLGLAAATAAMLVAIVPQPTPDNGTRFKGTHACCGLATLRVQLNQGGVIQPLPSRVVTEGQLLDASAVLSEPGWAALYDIHLATQKVRRLGAAERNRGVTAMRATTLSFSPKGVGKHVVLLVATAKPRALSRSDVIELLVSLGKGVEPEVDGQPCSVDLYRLDVKP